MFKITFDQPVQVTSDVTISWKLEVGSENGDVVSEVRVDGKPVECTVEKLDAPEE